MQLRKALPQHNSSGRHQAGGILALLASSLLLAAGAALARPDWCGLYNEESLREFFEEATTDDVARCIPQGALSSLLPLVAMEENPPER
ncbi:MAG: hypothetical protein F4099_01970 [Synechococcus sp. SB0673_bin_10]|nr:hypothetical protein [Cyanobacteria bacterium MAG IRC3_bin_20]MDE0647480.1 hypothetical protein [Cyanobacteria bacterium MAG IRC4_bin_6]MXY18637.1 hypothetical protein [Synechococcus sp. SB0664_bin_36]MYG64773.1 hypothetical protein [Synechococcus sp. SB0675_bin_7]MYI71286.1 hypothetical protein [Synechococcus sp. SB0673_bin_10]MYK06192.1 hypothetical protein [Synechococcus sp. SB0670_bin_20]MYK85729.1 hypothetical protein [Synechococcus sp. SB0669_bin_7]